MPIAVIGMGCRLPGGIHAPEQLWEVLRDGREVIDTIPAERWDLGLHGDPDPTKPLHQHVTRGGFVHDLDQFDPGFFGITAREAVCMDPQHRLLLEVCWRAFEDAAQPRETLRGSATGVFMGISSADYVNLLWASEHDYAFPNNEPFVLTGSTGCIAANRISYCFDLKGPSFTVDTACSSSLVAIHLACESLRRGECSMALAGGAQALLHPGVQMSFCKAGLLSADGRCKSFDASADGYVRSEGAGAVLLKPLAAAERDGDPIQAVILGSAINSDGRSLGLAAPSRRAQIQCLQQAYKAAQVDPGTTLYVEAHGTGTRLGDPVELKALGAVVGAAPTRQRPCRVGSVKTNLGHSETAAGITGLIKAVLCLKQRQLPPSLHCQTPNPAVDFNALQLQVQTELEPFPQQSIPAVVGVSAFGFGGTNAHCVLREAPAPETRQQKRSSTEPPLVLLCLSAQSDAALSQLAAAYGELLEKQPDLSLNDLCASTHLGRSSFAWNQVMVAADRDELLAQLRGQMASAWRGEASKQGRRVGAPAVQLGVAGAEGREQLRAIAQAIGAGHPCDWRLLHAPYPHRRIQIPGHPFLNQRYWWSHNGSLWREQLGWNGGEVGTSTPNLQQLDLPGDQRHWQVSLSTAAGSDLGDHRLNGEAVFPGAGYLAYALEVNQPAKPLGCLRLEQALALGQTAVTLQLVDSHQQLQCFARSAAEEPWRRVATLEHNAPPTQELTWQQPPETAAPLDVGEVYAAFEQVGLQYGPSYRSLRQIRAVAGEAWATLERVGAAPDRTLLDGCFQSVAAAISPELIARELMVPVGLEGAQFSVWPLPSRLQCYCRLRPQPSGARASSLQADLVLWADGVELGWVRGLKLERQSRATPLQTTRLTWQRLDGAEASQPGTPLKPWLQERGLLLPDAVGGDMHVLWPNLEQVDPVRACQNLLLRLQGEPQALMVVLEGTGPSAMALAALLRCATQELAPAWTITTLQIPDPGVLPPQAHDWPHLLEAASAHSDLRWEKGHLLAPVIQPWPSGRFRIASDGRGALEGLQPLAMKAAVLQPGQLELRVEATGLNFRDVLYALALLDPQEVGFACAEDLPLGGECVGRVVGVGPGVDPALVGTTMVAALAVGSLASHVVVAAERCVPLPPGLTSSEGAAVSTAFLTAMYGLEQLADLQAGDTVLIHAAAGGVGQAAIQIAQRRGARILATASEAKQAALLTQGVEAVFDSRSLAFSDQVLAHTEDRGVDVVLNSLKGPWVEASFRCLAQGGRFVELGKLEVWSSDDVHIRRPDVRYRCFDLLEVVEREPGLIRSMLEGLMHDLSSGQLRTPPLRSFPIEQCDEAFRWMAQARHVGKVVLTQAPPLTIRRDATYVVSGALGGIGPQLVDWLVEQGARSLLLVGREQRDLEERAEPLLQRLRQRGVRAGVVGCNLGCGDSAALQTALGQLPAAQSVRGLFHAAGVLRDRRLTDLSNADLAAVMAPKAQGLEQLEQACPGLEFVVGFSSIAALLGSPGQAAYAAANGAMEGLTGAEGPRRLTIQWGPWSGEGMAASHGSRFSAQGIGLLPPAAALEQLGQLMEQGADGVVAVTQNDWARLLAQAPPRQRPWFQALNSTAEAQDDGQRERLWQQLEGLPAAEQEQRLVSALAGVLERVMVAEQGSEADQLGPIDPTASLFELGVDSLMAAEFTALVQAELGLALDLRNLSDDPSLASLGARARLELFGSSTDGEAGLDLAAEAQLSCDWQLPDQPPARCPGSAILLTGASGYLGAYLLAGQLQRWPELTVQCLVRASSEQAGLERVRSNLEHYGLWQAAWEARLRVVPGDLAQPRFGLDADRFAALARGLGGILHNGAQLSQMAPYAQLAAANVEGTRTVLELACTAQPLRVELISSVAVLEAAAYRNQDVLETDPVDAWQGIHLGYSQTKWVSEQLVWNAGKAGLPVAVYRPPLIGGHSQTGQWHEGDLLQRLLQGALALGMAPDLAWALDTVPVDYVADAVTALAWDPATHGRCFHLQHPEPMLLAELVGLLQAEGAPLQLVPMHAWIRAIEAEPTNQLYPLLSFLQQRWGAEQLTYPELNSKGLRSRPSSEATSEALAKHGVQCPAFAQLVGPWAQALMGSRC